MFSEHIFSSRAEQSQASLSLTKALSAINVLLANPCFSYAGVLCGSLPYFFYLPPMFSIPEPHRWRQKVHFCTLRYTPSGGGCENGVTLTRQGLEVSVMILSSTKCFLTGHVTHDTNSPSVLLEDSRCRWIPLSGHSHLRIPLLL